MHLHFHDRQDLRPSIEQGWVQCAGSPYTPSMDEVTECRLNLTLEQLRTVKVYCYTNGIQTIRMFFDTTFTWLGGVHHEARLLDVPNDQLGVQIENPVLI